MRREAVDGRGTSDHNASNSVVIGCISVAMSARSPRLVQHATSLLKKQAGPLRLSELLALGIHPETVQALKAEGILQPLSRGLYQLGDAEPLGEPDLVVVARRVPGSVFCLLTALAFHDLTTQNPHEVHVALKRGRRRPRIEHPPLRVFWWGGEALSKGVDRHAKDGTELLITSPERSIADAFRYRKEFGLDLAIEALRAWRERRGARPDKLMSAAKAVRAERLIRPYLEAVL